MFASGASKTVSTNSSESSGFGNAAVVGAVSALGGLTLAYEFDTPAGTTIVCVAAALFALTSLTDLRRG
jgi:ABC-type Mn2+/Zn2+ transport system permease subunit